MLELIPSTGLTNFKFGNVKKNANLILGEPEKVNITEEFHIWEYYDRGLALFFGIDSGKLSQIEVEETEVVIWGIQIMYKSSEDIMAIIKNNTKEKVNVINSPSPCLIYRIDSLGFDFYFESKKLTTITAY